jgi:hypothetical protein
MKFGTEVGNDHRTSLFVPPLPVLPAPSAGGLPIHHPLPCRLSGNPARDYADRAVLGGIVVAGRTWLKMLFLHRFRRFQRDEVTNHGHGGARRVGLRVPTPYIDQQTFVRDAPMQRQISIPKPWIFQAAG